MKYTTKVMLRTISEPKRFVNLTPDENGVLLPVLVEKEDAAYDFKYRFIPYKWLCQFMLLGEKLEFKNTDTITEANFSIPMFDITETARKPRTLEDMDNFTLDNIDEL